jgi:hypothetical protein
VPSAAWAACECVTNGSPPECPRSPPLSRPAWHAGVAAMCSRLSIARRRRRPAAETRCLTDRARARARQTRVGAQKLAPCETANSTSTCFLPRRLPCVLYGQSSDKLNKSVSHTAFVPCLPGAAATDRPPPPGRSAVLPSRPSTPSLPAPQGCVGPCLTYYCCPCFACIFAGNNRKMLRDKYNLVEVGAAAGLGAVARAACRPASAAAGSRGPFCVGSGCCRPARGRPFPPPHRRSPAPTASCTACARE